MKNQTNNKNFFKREDIMKAGTPIPEKTRREVWERCGGRCEHCGKKAVDIHHIKYRSQGGNNNKKNLIALCRKDHDDIEIRQIIAENSEKYIGKYEW